MKKKILKIVTILIIFSIVINSLSLISFAENNTYNQKIISAQKVRNNGISNFPESYQILLNKLVDDNILIKIGNGPSRRYERAN